MYTRVSGRLDRSEEEVQKDVQEAAQDFEATLETLRGVKRQYRDLKATRLQRKVRQMKEEK